MRSWTLEQSWQLRGLSRRNQYEEVTKTEPGYVTFQILSLHNRTASVSIRVQQSQNVQTLLPTLMSAQPSRRLGKEEQRDEEDEARNALDTPCDPEGSRAADKSAAVANEVHDEHSPLDSPLLYTNDATSDATRGELSKVDADLRTGDTDRETRY